MDSFENIIGLIFERNGYWVKTCYKVDLTKEEKRAIGRPSSPRWELDVIAYNAATNEIAIIECKSYLDSTGVSASSFEASNKYAGRYKLFTEETLRKVVLNRLARQMEEEGLCRPNPITTLCLAAGNFKSEKDLGLLEAHFNNNGWKLMSPAWIINELKKISDGKYENEIASVVTKLIFRNCKVS